ncbi:MAG: hypothetical protein C0501_03285 [Isosphaera sp.]|nr:hypothetical protein [Isosphaera sp.]
MIKRRLAALARYLSARVLNRELVFLPPGGAGGGPAPGPAVLPVRYTTPATRDGWVSYRLRADGDLAYRLHAATFSDTFVATPGPLRLSLRVAGAKAGDTLEVNLLDLTARHNGRPVEAERHEPAAARKFLARVEQGTGPHPAARTCVHYLPFENKPIGQDYYFGDDYVDYPEQQKNFARQALDLVGRYCPRGRLLEVGCALGLGLRAFLDAGYDAYGVDVSEFAVAEAAKRVGPDRVRRCNVDQEPIPFPGPFDAVFLWDVLEHSADPAAFLRKLTGHAAPGSWIFIHTSNAESLTRRLLGPDWEGYYDYSHYGIDRVSVTTVPAWLRDLGWRVERTDCYWVWVDAADPALRQLADAFTRVPELAALLAERDLGDMILVVARKE